MIPKNNDMRFEVSTKCNYRCVLCPREKITRKIETMSLGLFQRLFDKIIAETDQYNTLSFPGMGEPLLDKTLVKKIEYAKKKKKDLSVMLLTNGSMLTFKKFKELESAGMTSVRVSFYGNDRSSYSRVHGIKNKYMFDRVKDNLLKISKVKAAAKLLLTFNVVVGFNDRVLGDWINFWEKKVDLIEVWRPHNWVDGRRYREIQVSKLKTCGRPFIGPLQVQVDGTINMCCFDFDGKLTIGDLKNQTLKQIFSSSIYKKILRCHKTGNFQGSKLICEKCDQRNSVKTDIMIHNSKFDIDERVNMISTTYKKII